jgi:hypothetical protein
LNDVCREYVQQLSPYKHTTNTLVPEKFGFVKYLSIEKAGFKLTDRALKVINHEVHFKGILYDVREAFDCINHEILLDELHFIGIQGTAVNSFRSYLLNRKQKV